MPVDNPVKVYRSLDARNGLITLIIILRWACANVTNVSTFYAENCRFTKCLIDLRCRNLVFVRFAVKYIFFILVRSACLVFLFYLVFVYFFNLELLAHIVVKRSLQKKTIFVFFHVLFTKISVFTWWAEELLPLRSCCSCFNVLRRYLARAFWNHTCQHHFKWQYHLL